MTLSELKQFLLWCTVINYGVVLLWFGMFVLARGWMYRLLTRWFRVSTETFDAFNLGGLALYEIGILLLNLVPLLALLAMS